MRKGIYMEQVMEERVDELVANQAAMLAALKYARRFLNKKDHDTTFVDEVIAAAEGKR